MILASVSDVADVTGLAVQVVIVGIGLAVAYFVVRKAVRDGINSSRLVTGAAPDAATPTAKRKVAPPTPEIEKLHRQVQAMNYDAK